MWTKATDTWRLKCGERGPICPRLPPSLSVLAKPSPSRQKVSSRSHLHTVHLNVSLRSSAAFVYFIFSQTFFTLSDLPPAGIDYVGISRNLDFAPGVSMQTFKVTVLDDLGQPELEGVESFELVLRMPVNGILGEPAKAMVFINDSVSDCKCFLTFTSGRHQDCNILNVFTALEEFLTPQVPLAAFSV